MPALGLALSLPFRPMGAGASAPAAPQGFEAQAAESAIDLVWDPQPEADTFTILIATTDNIGASSTLTTAATGTGYTHDGTDTPFQIGERYFFWLKAVNGDGESAAAGSSAARSFVTVDVSGGTRSVETPTGTWTIGTIIFSSNSIPAGSQISANSTIYVYTGAMWLDTDDFSPANGVSISGPFTFINNSGSPYTFWNIEP